MLRWAMSISHKIFTTAVSFVPTLSQAQHFDHVRRRGCGSGNPRSWLDVNIRRVAAETDEQQLRRISTISGACPAYGWRDGARGGDLAAGVHQRDILLLHAASPRLAAVRCSFSTGR